MNQSPRVLGSIRAKGYRFFPELEGQASELRARWSSRRKEIRQGLETGLEGAADELRHFEGDVAPIGRMLDRLRKLFGGIATSPFELADGELAVWYEDTFVVARGQRIPVALYLTTERFILVRATAPGQGRNVRDYQLSSLKGVAALSTPEGAVFVFGAQKVALGSNGVDYWKKLLSRVQSSEFRSTLAPEHEPETTSELTILETEEVDEEPESDVVDSAATAILTPELIAQATAQARQRSAPRPAPPQSDPEPNDDLITIEPETLDETQRMDRPSREEIEAGEQDARAADLASELFNLEPIVPAVLEPVSSDDLMPPDEPASGDLAYGTDGASAGGDEPAPLPKPEPEPEAEPLGQGPGGHDIIAFDSVFAAGDDGTDGPAQPGLAPAAAIPRLPAPDTTLPPPPSPPPNLAQRLPAPPPALEPSSRPALEPSPPPPPQPEPAMPQNPAMQGLASKDAFRARMRTESARYVITSKERTAASTPVGPGAPAVAPLAPASRKTGIVFLVVAVVLMLLFVMVVMLSRKNQAEAPGMSLETVEQKRPQHARPGATPNVDAHLPIGEPVEEELVATSVGPRPYIAGTLPEPVEEAPGPATAELPPYDPAVASYRIDLSDGNSWVVRRYQRLGDRIRVEVKGNTIELEARDVAAIAPAASGDPT